MSDLLTHKLKWFRKIDDCPMCDSFRAEVYFPDEHYGEGQGEVDEGYLPRSGMKASSRFYCGSEFAIDEMGEIICTCACIEICQQKAGELDEMAYGSFDDGDTLEDAP